LAYRSSPCRFSVSNELSSQVVISISTRILEPVDTSSRFLHPSASQVHCHCRIAAPPFSSHKGEFCCFFTSTAYVLSRDGLV
jgi:hypothetical protein